MSIKIATKLMNLGFVFLLFCSSTTQAVSIPVLNNNDSGPNSLRTALRSATAGDVIQFDNGLAGQTLTLGSALPIIEGVSVIGPSGGNFIIEGSGSQPGFLVYSGSNVTISNFTFNNVINQGGHGGAGSGGGGGALGAGAGLFVNENVSLTTENLVFSKNQSIGGNAGTSIGGGYAGGGGGFGSNGGNAVSNAASGGGGLYNSSGGDGTASGSSSGGGGLYNSPGGSSTASLSAGGGGGGGLYNSPGGNTTIVQGGGSGGGGFDNSPGGVSLDSQGPGGGGGGVLSPGNSSGVVTGGNGGGPNGGTGGTSISLNGGNAGVEGGGGGGASNTLSPGGNGGNGGSLHGGGGGGGGSSVSGGAIGGNANYGGGGGGFNTQGGNTVRGGGGGAGGSGNGGSSSEIGGGGGAGAGATNTETGGDGGFFGGGGGGRGFGGDGGFGGGGGGAVISGGLGGFGAGNGRIGATLAGAGSGLGGALFIRSGSIATLTDGGFSGNNVAAGTGGSNSPQANGKDAYLMNNSTLNYNITNPNQSVTLNIGGNDGAKGGTLNKNGAGALHLFAESFAAYNGDVNVNAGNLFVNSQIGSAFMVNSGGVLRGTGLLGSLTNSGRVAPGNSIGTLSVAGPYVQTGSGVLEIEINSAGQTDLLQVGTTASLAGTVEVLPAPGVYFAGTTYTFLTANAGVNGTFSTLSQPSPFQFQVLYGATFAQLRLLNNVFTFPFSPGGNAGRVLNYLTTLSIDPGSDLATVVSVLAGLNEEQFRDALEEISPVWFGNADWATSTTLSTIRSRLSRRSLELFDPCQCTCRTGGEGWVSYIGNHLHQSRLGELPGFHSHDNGILVGYDNLLDQDLLFGVSGGYTHTHLKWNSMNGHVKIDSGHFAPYAEIRRGCWLFDTSIIGSVHYYRTNRHIEFSSIDRHAKSHHHSGSVLVHLGAAYDWNYCNYDITPYAGVDYIYFHHAKFREHGANSLNLKVRRHDVQFLRSEIGALFERTFQYCNHCIIPTVKLGFVAFTPLAGSHIRAGLTGYDSSFFAKTTNRPIYQFAPGFDLEYQVNEEVSFNASYEGYFGHYQQDQNVTAGLSWKF